MSGGGEAELLAAHVARLRASVMAATFALLGGVGLFVATAWLLVLGGDPVGPHLSLLGNYFPGYAVTWGGAFVGFGWGAALGGALGWSLAWIYNWLAPR
jgi:hypothetical protein